MHELINRVALLEQLYLDMTCHNDRRVIYIALEKARKELALAEEAEANEIALRDAEEE